MVIRRTVIGIGVTIAIAVFAAFLLNRFRGPLENIFQSAGQTIGGFIAKPIEGVIQGFSAVAGQFSDIELKLPSIIIKQGTLEFTGDDSSSSLAGQTVPFNGGQFVEIPPDTVIDPETGIVTSSTPPKIVPSPEVGPTPLPNDILPEAEGASLTLFGDPQATILVGTGGEAGFERLTREEILAQNPNAVGLFDLLETKKTEFLPLGVEAVKFFQQAGQELRLSAQLFEEIPNIRDVV